MAKKSNKIFIVIILFLVLALAVAGFLWLKSTDHYQDSYYMNTAQNKQKAPESLQQTLKEPQKTSY
jgi:uncharacterized protein YxeA